MKKLANKILFLSDRPEDTTGLARVGRDLASLVSTMPEFKVGFLGRGSQGMAKFPWTTYSYPISGFGTWGENHLAGVVDDFFGKERGIVFSNWDISRLGWMTGLGLSDELARAYNPKARNWDLWGYFPVDGVGPSGASLGVEACNTVSCFNRVLAASEWGAGVLRASGRPDADWIPHGIKLADFTPNPKARSILGWKESDVIVGMVASNQARKDYPVAFHTAALLKEAYGNRFKFWLHTDAMVNYWSVYSLSVDYGLQDCLEVTMARSDEEMSLRYAACDCTMLPSAAEGFGFPIAESMACGTACVVTDYAAGQELVEEESRVKPVAFRLDTIHNVQRAVLSGHGFVKAVAAQIEKKREDPEYRGGQMRAMVEHLDWDRLRIVWERWFREGLR